MVSSAEMIFAFKTWLEKHGCASLQNYGLFTELESSISYGE
jgi:hypothetical protein